MTTTISNELAAILAERIRAYPSLYKTGGDVLNNYFCVIGTGFEWVNGEIVYPYDDDNGSIHCDYSSFESWCESRGRKVEDGFDFNFWHPIFESEKHAYENSLECAHNMELTSGYHYPVSEYSKISTIPDDVKPVWAEGARLAQNLIDSYPDYYTYEKIKKYKQLCSELEKLEVDLDGLI